MPKITNHTRQTLDFVVVGKPKDGVPPTKSIGPGETVDIDVRDNDPVLLGRIAAGAVTLSTAARSTKQSAEPTA